MQYEHDVYSEQRFDEVVIAKFNSFQITIPSSTQIVPRKIFSTWIPLSKRIYYSRGGVVWNRQLSFSLSALRIQNLFEESSSFPELRRLAVGVPISF